MAKPDLMIVAGGPPPGEAGAEGSERDTVPLSALQMPDDQEQMTPPEVGDQVNYQVTGKVVSIEGDQAVIERETINGQALDGGGQGEPDEDDLQEQAQSMDNGPMPGM